MELKKWMISEGVNKIGEFVNDCSYMFYYDTEKQKLKKLEAIKIAFNFHYKNNDFYRNFCKQSGNFTPSDLVDYSDIRKIPLLPASFFKEGKSEKLMSLPMKYKQLEFHTSGVGGSHSTVYRDSITNELSNSGLYHTFFELLDMRYDTSPVIIYFTPSILEAPNLGMLRALSILGSVYADRIYAVENNQFKFKEASDYIAKWNGKLPIYVVGPPFIISFFMEYLKANNKKYDLGESARILTIGGWKRHSGEIISRMDLVAKCKEFLGVKESQHRDSYGLIELNQLSLECSFWKKHIPPFADMYTRDINDLNSAGKDNEPGRVAIIDPTVIAYPGFLLTQDIGIVEHEQECKCGRCGSFIQIIGRAPQAEDINCSITLDQYLEGITTQLKYNY